MCSSRLEAEERRMIGAIRGRLWINHCTEIYLNAMFFL